MGLKESKCNQAFYAAFAAEQYDLLDIPYYYFMFLLYQGNSAWGLVDAPGGYMFADWFKWQYKANQSRYIPIGGEMFKEQALWAIFDIGIDDTGWLPGYWRCEYFFYPIWTAMDVVYQFVCQMDWWPWLRDGSAKIKTYVYTVPEGAVDDPADADGAHAKSLKTNLLLTFISILGMFALESPDFDENRKNKKKRSETEIQAKCENSTVKKEII